MPFQARRLRLRTPLGLLVAVLSVALVLPEWLTPLARWFTTTSNGALDLVGWLQAARQVVAALGLATAWPILPAVVSLGLFTACWLIPAGSGPPPKPRAVIRDETTIAVGALLLAEPLMYLGFLAWSGWHPSPMSRDAVLPVPFQAVAAGADGWWEGMLTILTYSLVVPLAEELFFRGRLLDLLRTRLGGTRMATLSAVSLTTLTFAAAHGTPVQALFALPLGLLLALMRLRGIGIGACVLAHACHNALFLFIGPMLFAQPWAAPLSAFAGAMMVGAAWIHHPRTSLQARVPNRWRPLVAAGVVLVAGGVLTLTYPFYRQVQDRLWSAAAHRVVVMWRVDNDVLLRRLDYQEQRGRLDPVRRTALYELLLLEPCQRLPGGNPRQAQVLAQLDPTRFASEVHDPAIYEALIDLADCRARWERLGIAARTLARRSGRDLAEVATSHPECLLQWFPLPERQDDCVQQLMVTHGHDRRRLLAALEHAQPGKVADVLLALPVEQITPLDRRHLRLHYPDADARLADLVTRDPARARAFSNDEP
jgi:membrane protease YdiL (CAAX protease family)